MLPLRLFGGSGRAGPLPLRYLLDLSGRGARPDHLAGGDRLPVDEHRGSVAVSKPRDHRRAGRKAHGMRLE